MSRILYFDLFSGASGDMMLGALLDLGVPLEVVQNGLSSLPISGYRIDHCRVQRGGLSACRCLVELDADGGVEAEEVEAECAGPHDTRPLHVAVPAGRGSGASLADRGHIHADPISHGHAHVHDSDHDHGHVHAEEAEAFGFASHHHDHEHDHHHDHDHRHWADIRDMLKGSGLPAGVQEKCLSIFQALADAEGRIHGKPAEDVAFHEVGALDSIVDIVGIALALDHLCIDRFACSPANVGWGTVHCAHGILPVPAPATAALLEGFPVYSAGPEGERLTPTAAAVLASLVSKPGVFPRGTIRGIGHGAGKRDIKGTANILRCLLLEDGGPSVAEIAVLECNLDDMTPELVGDLMSDLLGEGALDVFLTPVQMKKGRPGVLLSVLCGLGDEERLTGRLLERSSTFGVRTHRCLREELQREFRHVETPFGQVLVKVGIRNGTVIKATPEYESCRKLAGLAGIPVQEAYRCAVVASSGLLDTAPAAVPADGSAGEGRS